MKNTIWIIAASLFLLGCSSSFRTTNQVSDSAFIQLQGNFIGTNMIIDGNESIQLSSENTKTFSLNGIEVARFPVSTGKHTIEIIRAGNIVVSRTIFVSNSNTFEVVVP